MIQAETEAIAQGMLQITDEFQKQTGIADEVVDRIIEHSFRKMELVQAPPEYILLLLPDELKNYCFRCAVNAQGKYESKGGWSECVIYADKPHATQDVPMHRSQNLLKGAACVARESTRATST